MVWKDEKMKITMAHGSGGTASHQLMEEIFAPYFHNPILDLREDAAILSMEKGNYAMSTDTFVVTPLFYSGGDIGKLSVCGTVNDLCCMGARPQYMTCGFILEEGLSFEVLERVVKSMAGTAKGAGIRLVAGDTKVIDGQGGLYINTTGIGRIPEGRQVRGANLAPGDAVLVTGVLGEHHATILSHRMNIENQIQSDNAPLNGLVEALFDAKLHPKAMRDITRGGLGTVLHELAQSSKAGVLIEEEKLPVSPAVQGFAEILGLDPLYMGNEGKLVVVVPWEERERALSLIRSQELGREAALVGQVIQGEGVELKTRLGGTRRVPPLVGEGLPRIC